MSKKSLALGAKWTALERSPHKHFEIISVGHGELELRCVVTELRCVVDRSDLRDPEQWVVGWK